jgi:outer membrane protein assembly factor BamB
MNQAAKSGFQPTSEPSKSQFPKKMLFITTAVLLLLFILRWQLDFLNEQFNLNPGVPHLLTIVLALSMVLAWAIWAFLFAKLRLLGLLFLLVPAILLVLFYPNFGGDTNIVGWKPRFWKAAVEYGNVASPENSVADLGTTSKEDFPQFLGVNRNATIAERNLATDWETSPPKLLWKQAIGEGWSGFAAVNGFAVTQEQRGELECVTCYRIETGELVWIHQDDRRHEDITAMGKVGPRATPTIAGGRVYTTSGTGVLDCLDGSNGELIWTVDVPELVGITQVSHTNGLGMKYTMEDSHLMWGRSGSPLIYKDKVIVTAGGSDDSPNGLTATLLAFDKLTGEEIWRGGARFVAYGSPSIGTVLGKQQILLVAEDHAVGHDPETGVEMWSHLRPGFSNADANCSQVTLVSDSRLLLSKGYNLGGELIGLSESGGKIEVVSLSKDTRILKTKLTNPVIRAGYAYSLSDGYLECAQLEPFRRKWKQRGRFGNGQVLLVGDHLLVHTEEGELMLISASPEGYQELGSIETIEGTCWNTMCLYGNRLLVRSELEAACFELAE